MSSETLCLCPECGGILSYRDSRLRICKTYGGTATYISIRRLECIDCNRLHTELPSFLVPYKHYASEVVENVLDDVSTPEDTTTEDYPCEMTMNRWKNWFMKNLLQIEGMLRSNAYRILGFSQKLLKSKASLLDNIRREGCGWLAAVLRFIYNSGFKLNT